MTKKIINIDNLTTQEVCELNELFLVNEQSQQSCKGIHYYFTKQNENISQNNNPSQENK